MALRDKIRARIEPTLDEGETYHASFTGNAGPSPWWILVSAWIYLIGSKARVVVVTDRGVYLCGAATFVTGKPKKLVQEFPLGTRIVRQNGFIHGKVQLGAHHVWVHQRFADDVEQADRASQRLAEAVAAA